MLSCALVLGRVQALKLRILRVQMSSPIAKSVRRSNSRQSSVKSTARSRSFKAKSARPKPMVKRVKAAKAPAKKARRTAATKTRKAKAARKPSTRPRRTAPAKSKSPKKTVSRKVTRTARQKKIASPSRRVKKTQAAVRAVRGRRPLVAPPTPPRQPTMDEASGPRSFERAHKEFTRGRVQEARSQFGMLLDRY